MIRFDNWTIQADGDILARQFDNLTNTLTVAGNVPAGWEWDVLVRAGDTTDTIPLTATESALSAVLTAQQLSVDGYYQIQLRATQGDKVQHTNTVNVYIPASLSGDKSWPVMPSEFSDMERRLIQTVREAENAAVEAENAAVEAENAVKTGIADASKMAAQNAATAAGQSAADASTSEQAAAEHRLRAEQRADLAKSYALNPPIVGENGNWLYWDGTQYVDSGKSSEGEFTREQANNLYSNALKDPVSGELLDINEVFKKLEQAIISMGGKI